MSARWRRWLQCAAACLLVAAYSGLSHYCNSLGDAHEVGAALALGPLAVLALMFVWRATPPPVALLSTVSVAGLLYGLWPLAKQNYAMFSLAQETGVYGLLGLSFVRSLGPGGIALCTRLADQVHGPLSPREVLYTRRVTAAWAMFFFSVAASLALLFAFAPLRIWSFYTNFCVLPMVGAMFVAEYAVRHRVLPETRRAGLLATIGVYFATSRP